ncbi:MAG: ABC transporter permease [Phycisphaerales bacterium]|nr:MAG: ABC transporter permease [Phycisphaerales bacterium]
MLALITRRLLLLPVLLLAVYTIVLALAWAIPGNPLDKPEGRRPSPEVVEAMQAQYNLDSFPRFYTSYLTHITGVAWARSRLDTPTSNATLHAERDIFDFGPSLSYKDQRVGSIIAASLPVSVTIGAAAMLIALVVGTAAGVLGAIKPKSLADSGTLALALLGVSLPSFVTGSALLLVFAVWLRLLPVAEWGSLRDLVLPSVTLSLPYAGYIARLARLGMIDAMGEDYIRTARAKGVREWRVVMRHALKNAFLPVLSYLGPACALAMTGSFVVERVFSIPGMGQHFVNAVQNKDVFLLIGVVLVFSTLLIVLNLAVDVLYRWVDPRIA